MAHRQPVSPDGKRDHRCNVDMTQVLFEKVQAFIALKHDPRFRGSRNELIDRALHYYMIMYEAANGELDRHGFPQVPERGAPPLSRRPHLMKRGG